MAERSYERDSSGARSAEHAVAWIFALIALATATLGLLVGFDVVDLNIGDEGAAVSVDGVGDAETSDSITATGRDNFQDALLWLIPAGTAAMLAVALHRTEHHRGRRQHADGLPDRGNGMFSAEHALAYVGALAALAASILCVVVGYDVFDNANTVQDGQLWGIAGFIVSTVTVALHSVRHHQLEADEDVIVRLIEERTSRGMAPPRPERVPERRDEPTR